MQQSKPLQALLRRRTQVRSIHAVATEHTRWMDRLCEKYSMPRAQLARALSGKGDLEYEIAVLINDSALAKARAIISERGDWPDGDSPDLYERAVYGHWRRLRDLEMAAAGARVAETKALLGGERVLVKDGE